MNIKLGGGYHVSMSRLYYTLLLLGLLCAGRVWGAELQQGAITVVYQERDAQLAARSMEVLAEAVAEFGDRLAVGEAPVRVIMVGSINEFLIYARHYSQVAVSGIAHSSEGLIAVKPPRLRSLGDDYFGTLRHELVHILLYRNTDTGILPRWLNEGIAMSLANEYRWASSLQMAKMFVRNRVIEYRNLDFAFLAPGNEMEFGDAYAQAHSMTRFLRDRIGEEKFWAVVLGCKGGTFPDALRDFGDITPQQFWQEYQRSLWRVAVIGTLTSGSLFTPASFLLIIAYFRKRHTNRKTLRRWAAEEAAAGGGQIFSWDRVVEDPEEWKKEYLYDEEDESW